MSSEPGPALSPSRPPPPPPGRPNPKGNRCPRCGETSEPLQEYCLKCGWRLPSGATPLARAVARLRGRLIRLTSRPYSGGWRAPVAFAFAVAVVAAVAAIVLSGGSGTERASTPAPATTTPAAPKPAAATPPETAKAAAAKPKPATTKKPAATKPKPAAKAKPAAKTKPRVTTPKPASSGTWPAGRSGYTVVLAALSPTQVAVAAAKAKAARAAGLPRVGVLESSRYRSLRAGYLVVFSGVYATIGEAEAAAGKAQAAGFPGAYPREVAP